MQKVKDFENLIEQSLKKLENVDPETLVKELSVNPYLPTEAGAGDIRNKIGIGNYCFFPGFLELLKPRQIVEIGSAMGVGSVCMLSSAYKDFEFYGITLEEHGLEFCYVEKDKYPNFHPVIGDYMDLSFWPIDVYLNKTDFWYVDGLHEGAHVTEQILLYKPFFKSGTIIAFDDIFLSPDMEEMWHGLDNILDIKHKLVLPLHHSGWGILQIK